MTIVELVVWMGTTVGAAVGFLIVASVCIGGVLGPMAVADPACLAAGAAPGGPAVGVGVGKKRATDDGLTPVDLVLVREKQREVREKTLRRHGGVLSAGKQDGRAGLVMVDVEA